MSAADYINRLIVNVIQKHTESQTHDVFIDLSTWDELTPKERFEFVEKDIEDNFPFSSRYDGFTIPSFRLEGKFSQAYEPQGEITLTLADLRHYFMLQNQWESMGYDTFEAWASDNGWTDEFPAAVEVSQ